MEQVYSTEHLLRDFFGVFLKTGSHVPKTPRSVKYRSKTPRSQYYLPKSKYRISFERFAQNIASTCLFGGNKTSIPCSCKQNAWVLHTVSTCGLDLCTWKNQISNSKPDTSHTRQCLHYLKCHLPPPFPAWPSMNRIKVNARRQNAKSVSVPPSRLQLTPPSGFAGQL